MLNSILLWIANLILDYLYKKAVGIVNEEIKSAVDEKKLVAINDKNVKAYQEAKDRATRVSAAIKLLNRQ